MLSPNKPLVATEIARNRTIRTSTAQETKCIIPQVAAPEMQRVDVVRTLQLCSEALNKRQDFRIKCRIPGTRPTYSPVNFTREHVGQNIFLHFSNSLVNMLGKSLVNMLAKALVNMLAETLVNMLGKSLVNMLTKSLMNMLAEALVNMLAKSLVNMLAKSLMNMMAKALVNMLAKSLVKSLVNMLAEALVNMLAK